MWLTGVLVLFLILVKPSTADLGLPIPILGLKEKIHSLVANARKYGKLPVNKTLQDLEALPWPNLGGGGYSYQRARHQWQAALVDLSWIQNYTLANLTKALYDQRLGHRRVFDDLYGSMEKLKEQVAEDRWLSDGFYELRGGPEIMQLLNKSRAFLETGLDALRDTMKKLDDAISEAQRVKHELTLENISEFLYLGMAVDVWREAFAIVESTGCSDFLAEYFIVASKLVSQDSEEFKVKLKQMVDWKDFLTVANATDIAVTTFQTAIPAPITKLNLTVWTGYKELSENKLIQGVSSIEAFIENFNVALHDLNNSVMDEAQSIFHYVENLISGLKFSFDQQIDLIQDSAAEKIFTHGNSSVVESCVKKHSLLNETVGKAITFMGSCTWERIQYLPDLVKTFEEFFQPISAAAMAPLDDLQLCNSSILDHNLCLQSFVTTYMLEFPNDSSTGKRTLMAVKINRLVKLVDRVLSKEFLKLYIQLDSCFNRTITEHILEELNTKRLACYDDTV